MIKFRLVPGLCRSTTPHAANTTLPCSSNVLKSAFKSSQKYLKTLLCPALANNLYRFGEFSLDAQGRVLKRGAEAVPLTRKAFDALFLLIQNAGRTVTKDELMGAVWPGSFVEESNLTQTIFMVRKALDETAERRYILTVQGEGYRFLLPVAEGHCRSRSDRSSR